MNPRLLQSPGPIENADKDYLCRFEDLASIKGKKCLCIGYSEAEIDQYVIKYQPSEVVLLTYWAEHPDAMITKYPLVIGDITQRTAFADDEFDVVLTLSLLEHLQNVEDGLIEIRRILKPRGALFILFGPAWSSAYGHHVYIKPGDSLMDFTTWSMPSHIHLLCDSNEIRQYYIEYGYTAEQCEEVLHWYFEAPIINRVMYEDYIRLFSKHFLLAASEIMFNYVDRNIVMMLRSKYAPCLDFSTYGGKYVLIKG